MCVGVYFIRVRQGLYMYVVYIICRYDIIFVYLQTYRSIYNLLMQSGRYTFSIMLLTMQKKKKFIHDLFNDIRQKIVLYLLLSKNLGFLVDKILDMTKSVH